MSAGGPSPGPDAGAGGSASAVVRAVRINLGNRRRVPPKSGRSGRWVVKPREAWDDPLAMRIDVDRHRTMSRRPLDHSRVAFSLIELVIIVVIIGFLAAIAIPRLSGASSRARDAALVASLSTLQSAIDRYIAEHEGLSPSQNADGSQDADAANFTLRLTKKTDVKGNVSESGMFGPYISSIPVHPVSKTTTVRLGGTRVPAGRAYRFDLASGQISSDFVAIAESGIEEVR